MIGGRIPLGYGECFDFRWKFACMKEEGWHRGTADFLLSDRYWNLSIIYGELADRWRYINGDWSWIGLLWWYWRALEGVFPIPDRNNNLLFFINQWKRSYQRYANPETVFWYVGINSISNLHLGHQSFLRHPPIVLKRGLVICFSSDQKSYHQTNICLLLARWSARLVCQ